MRHEDRWNYPVTLYLRLADCYNQLSFKRSVAPGPIPWNGDVGLGQNHMIFALEISTLHAALLLDRPTGQRGQSQISPYAKVRDASPYRNAQ